MTISKTDLDNLFIFHREECSYAQDLILLNYLSNSSDGTDNNSSPFDAKEPMRSIPFEQILPIFINALLLSHKIQADSPTEQSLIKVSAYLYDINKSSFFKKIIRKIKNIITQPKTLNHTIFYDRYCTYSYDTYTKTNDSALALPENENKLTQYRTDSVFRVLKAISDGSRVVRLELFKNATFKKAICILITGTENTEEPFFLYEKHLNYTEKKMLSSVLKELVTEDFYSSEHYLLRTLLGSEHDSELTDNAFLYYLANLIIQRDTGEHEHIANIFRSHNKDLSRISAKLANMIKGKTLAVDENLITSYKYLPLLMEISSFTLPDISTINEFKKRQGNTLIDANIDSPYCCKPSLLLMLRANDTQSLLKYIDFDTAMIALKLRKISPYEALTVERFSDNEKEYIFSLMS